MSYKATLWAMEQQTGSPTRKAVLCAIASFADAKGEAKAVRLKLICERSEASKSSAQRAIAYFRSAKLLEVSERPGRADGYNLNLEHKTQVTVTGVGGGVEEGEPRSERPGGEVTVTSPEPTEVTVTSVSTEPRSERPGGEVTVTGPTTLEHGLVTTHSLNTDSNVVVPALDEWAQRWETWVLDTLRSAGMPIAVDSPARLRAWLELSGVKWPDLQGPVEAVAAALRSPKRPEYWPRVQSVRQFTERFADVVDWMHRQGKCRNQHVAPADRDARREEMEREWGA